MIEKVKLTTGIQTDVSPKAIDTQGNRLLVNPILDALNARYVSSNDGNEFLFESVKGNVKVTNADLPVGTNIQIGSFEDIQNNVLIFFLYNSGGQHGVYKYSPEDGTISTVIKSSFLNFQNNPRYLITGIGIQDDLLYWSDGFNPQRAINMTRDYSAITSDKPITLIKEHPTTRPDVLGASTIPQGDPFFRDTDVNIPVNKISDKNLQFSYQYVFIDNEKSVIAPFSKMAYASLDPLGDIGAAPGSSKSKVPYRLTIPSDVFPFIKTVNLLVREGNEGAWSIWKKISPQSTSIDEDYTGYESLDALADAEAAKIQESVPTISKALCVHRNRVMVSADEEGFDVQLSSGAFPITMSITEVMEAYSVGPTKNTYFKRGGARTFGIALFDERGRSMGVFGKTPIKFTPADDPNNVTDNFETDSQRPYVTINLSGDLSASPKAKYFSIVCTDEEFYEDYIQIPAIPLFYKFDAPSGYSPSGTEFIMNGRVYSRTFPASASAFNKIHLILPRESPIIPTDEYLVRLMSYRTTSPFDTAKIERVATVLNSLLLVVNNFGITNWSSLSAPILFVEVFKIKQTPSNIFYEVTDRIAFNSGVPAQTSFTIYGDQYYGTVDGFTYSWNKFDITPSSVSLIQPNKKAYIETPSPTFGFINEVTNTNPTLLNASNRTLILDYNKKDWNGGKPFVSLDNPIQIDRSNVIRFSNRYLPDSSINGLSSFDSGDEYPLPVDRTSITKLVPVGNNVLAVHERSLTTLYVEQSMIKNAEGVEQLITTDRFIGYDRELQFKIGSYHPESVVEHLGLVFGFDIYKGVVWQYSNEGISEISRFGLRDFFATKAVALLPYKDTAKVLGGIDPYHKEYIISFVFPAGQEAQNETLAFNWEKNIWTTKYSFVPEGYAKVNNQLISFKNGELWVHNQSSVYNNFYGVQYGRRLRLAINPYPSRSKNWMAIQVATNLLSSGVDPEYLVVNGYTEDGQETYMKVDDFEKLEGVFYGPILKDINTLPALIEAGQIALRHGDDMLGRYIEIELNNDHTTESCPVQFLNVSYADSEYTQ